MREADKLLSNFSTKLDEVEELLQPLLANLDTVRTASENKDDFDALSLARLHITLCYTLNSLFCMYLRTQGVDPVSHPIMEHIDRAQDAFLRLRKVEAGIDSTKNPKPKRNVKEHIARTNLALEKLALVVFPEEYQLLQALRNREKYKQFENDKDDEKLDNEKLAKSREASGTVFKPLKDSDEEHSGVDDVHEESSPACKSKKEKGNRTSVKETEPTVKMIQDKVEEAENEDKAKQITKRIKKLQSVNPKEGITSIPGLEDPEATELFDSALPESKSYAEKERSYTKDKKQKKLKKVKERDNRIDQSDGDLKKESKEEGGTRDKKKKKRSKREESDPEKRSVEKSKKKKRKRSEAEQSSASAGGKERDLLEKRSKKKAKK